MKIHLRIWRQSAPDSDGRMVDYSLQDVEPQMSLLEVLDQLNEQLTTRGEPVVAFDHDCREGICGQCGLFIDGRPHGPNQGATTCQVYMRSFSDGDTITLEPWRAESFPVLCDLVVDRSAFDRVIEAGGYVSVNTGTAPEANAIAVGKEEAEAAFDAAACIGCGACVAVCKNSSAMLFVGAKVSHLAQLPQGRVERARRVLGMVEKMEAEGFGGCTLTGACEAECPKRIGLRHIARLNYEYLRARLLRLF